MKEMTEPEDSGAGQKRPSSWLGPALKSVPEEKPDRLPTDLKQVQRFIVVAVAVFLLNCVGLEIAARMFAGLAKPTLSHALQFDLKYRLAEEPVPAESVPVLLLGDSQVKYGVYADLLEYRLKEAGLSHVVVKNLATDAASLKMNLFLLKTAVAGGQVKPRLVVYNVNSLTFSGYKHQHPALSAEARFMKSYLGRCLYPENPPLSCQLEKYSALARYRAFFKQQWRPILSSALRMPETSAESIRNTVVISEFSPGGWAAGYSLLQTPAFRKKYEKQATPEDPQVRDLIAHYRFQWDDGPLRELRDYCREQDIPLLLVWMPHHALWPTTFGYFNVTGQQERQALTYLQNLADGNPSLFYEDLRDASLDDGNYFDPAHLNVPGALQVSERLADVLAGPRYGQLLK